MTSFVLKIIAMVTMIIDHSGDIFNPILGNNTLYFNAIGRIAFPLFCFLLVEGYRHTSNLKKYMLRLFIAALVSQIPFQILVVNYMHARPFAINVLFTLLFGLFALYIWNFKLPSKKESQEQIIKQENNKEIEKEKNNQIHSFTLLDVFIWIIKIVLISLLIIVASIANFDYGETGILLILAIFIIFKKSKIAFLLAIIGLAIINYRQALVDSLPWGITFVITASIIPFIFMALYNGKKGPNTKYGLYVIYPLHLILLELIRHFFII